MEDRYWCVTCRRSWPTEAWVARKWACPSGKGRHPHVAYTALVRSLGREPDEAAEDDAAGSSV